MASANASRALDPAKRSMRIWSRLVRRHSLSGRANSSGSLQAIAEQASMRTALRTQGIFRGLSSWPFLATQGQPSVSAAGFVAVGFCLGLPLSWFALKVGRRLGLLDVPMGIKVHTLPIPYT